MRSEERAGIGTNLQGPEPARDRAGNDRGSYRLQHGPGRDEGEGGLAAGGEGGGIQEVEPPLDDYHRPCPHYRRLCGNQCVEASAEEVSCLRCCSVC